MIITTVLFNIVAVCVILLVVLGLLSVWDYIAQDTAWRSMASIAIIGGGAGAVALVGRLLGVDW